MRKYQPSAPIPRPIRGAEVGSFAYNTVVVRLPEIGRRTMEQNNFPEETNSKLENLIQEIPDDLVRPLMDDPAPDLENWEDYVRPHAGENWLEIPWFFAETYFYRRILEATGFFMPGSILEGVDPFYPQKQQGLHVSREVINRLGDQLESWSLATDNGDLDRETALTSVLLVNLWGNQADLSMWPTGSQDRPSQPDIDQQRDHLLVDDLQTLVEFIVGLAESGARVAIILDNTGLELVHDLALADYLLSGLGLMEIQLSVKAHPTFVSDALKVDVLQAIQFLKEMDHAALKSMANRLENHVQSRRLTMTEDFFWNSPLAGWQMPDRLREEFARFDLIVSKGDANYRRWLGDRHWSFITPIDDILSYLPTPLAVLRVLKSEVAAGLLPGQPEKLSRRDPDWLVDGKWGMIQFVDSYDHTSPGN